MGLAKQSVITGILHTISVLALLVIQIIIARVFGPGGRGVFASVYAVSGFLVLTLSTGHIVSNAYFVASGKQTTAEAAGSSVLGLIVSVLLISVAVASIMFFRPSFVALASNQILFWGFLMIPFNLTAMYLSGILRGIGQAGQSYWYYGVANGSWLVAVVVFYFLFSFKSLEAVFISRIIAEIVAVGVMLYFLRSYIDRSWLKPQFKKFRESVAYSLRFYFTLVANPMAIRVELIVIPMFLLDDAALGLYAQAFAVLCQIMVVSNVVGYVLMPQVAKNAGGSVQLTAQVCRVVLTVTLLLGLFMMFASRYLVPLIFGRDFSPVVPLMWIMFSGVVVQSIAKVLYHYFQGINEPMTVSVIFFIGLVVMLAIDIISVPRIGIQGAAIGTLVTCFLETALFSWAFIKRSKIHWSELFILKASDWQYMSNKCLSYIKRRASQV